MNIEMLLTGSARIDQMRKEINAVIRMVFGLLPLLPEEKESDRYTDEFVIGEQGHCKWTFRNTRAEGRKASCWHLFPGKSELVYHVPGNEVELYWVEFVHGNLDIFVDGMTKLFPCLRGSLRSLYRAARRGPHLMYELRFKVPGRNPEYGIDAVMLRKKSGLSFPLPIGTELQFYVEDDGFDTMESFKVIGHTHNVSSVHGDMEERDFIMELDSVDGVANPKEFAEMLERNGWCDAY